MSVRGLSLGLFIHNHQPVGNYDFVFAELWRKAYRPMLEALSLHPGIRVTLHYSGPLIEWLEGEQPEFEALLGRLVGRGQVELAGGGWYEPILAMLPESDRIGQVRLMSRELQKRWGVRPRGLWLTERVWEPGLAASLAAAGVGYTLVDDSHFAGAGVKEDNLDGYYLTEDGGPPVAIFPGLRALRKSVPWRPVREVMQWLASEAQRRPGHLLAMGDDGEKFGGWPQTYEYCWAREGGWVEEFFSAVEASSDWLETLPLGEWPDREPANGPIYLPTGSYHEMEEWALPAIPQVEAKNFEQQAEEAGLKSPLLRAGFWRNFLVKYPEAGAMRQRGLRVRSLVDGAKKGRGAAERELWRGQCNCSYWHGIFGGLYLRHIRLATLRHLVRAEAMAHRAARTPVPFVRRGDFDLDGRDEIIMRTASQQLLVDPAEGGAIVEWDLVRPAWPLLSVVARRPEAYHAWLAAGQARSISPEARAEVSGAGLRLTYDKLRRAGAQEALAPGAGNPRALLDQAVSGQWEVSNAVDLAGLPWHETATRRRSRPKVELLTEADGLSVRKSVLLALGGPALEVRYEVSNKGAERWDGWLLSRWNIGLPGGDGHPGQEVVSGQPPELRIDAGGDIALVGSTTGFEAVGHGAVETVSSSERGVEVTYQGLCVALAWCVSLPAGKSARARIRWTAEVAARPRGAGRPRGGRGARPSRG